MFSIILSWKSQLQLDAVQQICFFYYYYYGTGHLETL